MDSTHSSTYTNKNCICDMAKGTGYFFGSAGAALALTILASAIAAFAAATLFYDGMFVYTYAVSNPVQLAWVIPAAIVFVGVDCIVIASIVRCASPVISGLAEATQHFGDEMLDHFGRALSSNLKEKTL